MTVLEEMVTLLCKFQATPRQAAVRHPRRRVVARHHATTSTLVRHHRGATRPLQAIDP
jgi:hypothetical protein